LSNIIGANLGVMFFHSQHGFNPSYVVNNKSFNQKDSGLLGSSFIQVPYFLKYFTGNIEYHHIHHMNSKIPSYNLQSYHKDFKNNNIVKLTLTDCYNNLWLVLYDEDNNKFITFNEAEKAKSN
jgi:omega-6 fatty acid desaturase (delta-12 desaturase)